MTHSAATNLFSTLQANALLRKNGVQQRRAWVQNLVAICMPIFFCLLLWALQKVINNGALAGGAHCCWGWQPGGAGPANSAAGYVQCNTWASLACANLLFRAPLLCSPRHVGQSGRLL